MKEVLCYLFLFYSNKRKNVWPVLFAFYCLHYIYFFPGLLWPAFTSRDFLPLFISSLGHRRVSLMTIRSSIQILLLNYLLEVLLCIIILKFLWHPTKGRILLSIWMRQSYYSKTTFFFLMETQHFDEDFFVLEQRPFLRLKRLKD